jgi:hypothetical protein
MFEKLIHGHQPFCFLTGAFELVLTTAEGERCMILGSVAFEVGTSKEDPQCGQDFRATGGNAPQFGHSL